MIPSPARQVADRTLAGFACAALLLAGSPGAAAGEPGRPSGGQVPPDEPVDLAEAVAIPPPGDAIAPAQLAGIRAAFAAHEKRKGAGAPDKADGPLLFPFFPQAGVLGRDLFLNNYTDQDPSPVLLRDFDCSDYAYDGHSGNDALIRSFREQAIGVPVFAVLPGVVVDTHDGEPDMRTELSLEVRANYVIIDHGGGYATLYLHLRRGSVAVAPGQAVQAGTQIGQTGSSGLSDWPHLHFETWKDRLWIEPSAGPCRPGRSFWAAQPPVVRDLYVADFFLSPGQVAIPSREAFLLDQAPRRATFLREPQWISVRVDLRNVPAGAVYRARLVTPRGEVARELSGGFSNTSVSHLDLLLFQHAIHFDALGAWRYQLEINGGLAIDAPFRVVAKARQIKNRPPNRIRVRLTPARPVEGDPAACEVLTSLVAEDPDYDIVSYRYEWRVNGRPVRSVESAALTDLLPAGVARARDRVRCQVTVSDGLRQAPPARATAIVGVP